MKTVPFALRTTSAFSWSVRIPTPSLKLNLQCMGNFAANSATFMRLRSCSNVQSASATTAPTLLCGELTKNTSTVVGTRGGDSGRTTFFVLPSGVRGTGESRRRCRCRCLLEARGCRIVFDGSACGFACGFRGDMGSMLNRRSISSISLESS